MIFLRYIVVIVAVGTVTCQEDKPDITLLSTVTEKGVDHTCVAGSNVDGSAITFITPIGTSYSETTSVSTSIESKYILQGKEYPNDEYNCDFEKNSRCTSKWSTTEVTAESVENGNNIQELVLDERWEKFNTFSDHNKLTKHEFSSQNINIGISVRTGGIASIVLCNNGTPMQCYWISLNENKTPTSSYCSAVNINKFNKEDSGCVNIRFDKIPKVTLSETNWNHFFLSRNISILKLCDKREKIGCMEYNDIENSFDITTMHLQLNTRGFWKIHDYAYLSLNQNMADGNWHDLGPELKPEDGTLCVTLYAATCKTCSIDFNFGGEEEIVPEFQNKFKKQWKYLKLTLSNATKTKYKLRVKATSSDSAGFWFIDDIRRCHINEIRVIKTSAPMSDKDPVSCVALAKPSWTSSIMAGKVGTAVNKICNNTEYIGNNCDISCSSVLGNDHCNKYIICKSTKKEPQCSCSAGYYGEQCNAPCPLGFYGYNCLSVCEPCVGFCTKSSGKCPDGSECTATYNTDYGCITALISPPDESIPWFYALYLLLLIIPIVGFIVYRKYRKSTEEQNNLVKFRKSGKSSDMKKKQTESGYGYLEPKRIVEHPYLEVVNNEHVYTTPDVQNSTTAEEHVYETVIYSTKDPGPPTYINLLPRNVSTNEE